MKPINPRPDSPDDAADTLANVYRLILSWPVSNDAAERKEGNEHES